MFKAELIRNKGPWKGIDDVEIAVAEYIDWFNHRHRHGEIGMVPPVEHEAQHYSENPVVETTETREPCLQQTRCDSGWRRGLKGLDLVAAAILCCVERPVGSLDQVTRGVLGPGLG